MKRLFALVLAFALCFSTMGMVPVQAAEEPIEITWMCHMDLATNKSWTTEHLPELLKKYGFNVKFRVIEMGTHDGVEYYNNLRTRIAAGDPPADIMQFDRLITEAVDANWYVPISMELIEQHMPKYLAAALDNYEHMPAYFKDLRDGTMYGIASWNMFGPCRHTMVYRKDWLDKLGMEVPETIEAFEEFLRACRKTDFNGNGEFDEYGYTSGTNSPFCGFNEVFGAFGAMPMCWHDYDGKILRPEVTEGAKKALETLARWYKEDLIPKGVNTTEMRRDGFNQGIRGSYGQGDGYAPALVKGGQNYEEFYSAQPDGEMLPAPAFKGPDGLFGTQQWGPRKYVTGFGSHLADDPGKLAMILDMLEAIATNEELFVAAMLGERGVHWDFTVEGAESGATKFLPDYTDFNKRLDEVGVREMSESPYCPVWVPEIYRKYLDPQAVEYASQNPGYFDMIGNGVTFASQIEYGADLDNYTKETFMNIITGKQPIEFFDEYVKTWYANGGQEMTEEAQRMYDEYFK